MADHDDLKLLQAEVASLREGQNVAQRRARIQTWDVDLARLFGST